MSMKINLTLAVVIALQLFAGHALAAGLEKIQFLKISPQDHKAVMKTPEGRLQLVDVGDVIGDAQVTEIVEGRVVLEEQRPEGPETIIFRLDGKHQRIERIRPRGEKAPLLFVPGKQPSETGATGKN